MNDKLPQSYTGGAVKTSQPDSPKVPTLTELLEYMKIQSCMIAEIYDKVNKLIRELESDDGSSGSSTGCNSK